MQSRRNAAGVNGVKVLSVVNARPGPLVNEVANEVRASSVVNVRPGPLVNGVRAPSVVNVRPGPLVNGVWALSVVNARPELVVSVVRVDHSSVVAVVREDQVVFCGCSL